MWLHHDCRHERHFSRVAWWEQDTDEVSLDIVLLRYNVRTSNLEPAYSDSRNLINIGVPYSISTYRVKKNAERIWAWANAT